MLPNLPELLEPRNILRLPVALEAAGALSIYPLFCSNHEYLNLYIGYLRQGAGGAYSLSVDYSAFSTDAEAVAAGVQTWFRDPAFVVGAVAAGTLTTSLVQQEEVSYTSVGAAQENIMLQILVRKGMERIRISVAETGAIATPGILEITSYIG